MISLGHEPDDLTVRVTKGEPWTSGLRLVNATWSTPPVLLFEEQNLSITATLSEEDVLAVWEMTPSQTATLTDGPTRVKVDGVTWWKGVVLCQL